VTQPSSLATWLLRHFGCGPNIDVVIGDLSERYAAGRSRLWYWRQATCAIVVGFFENARTHKLMALRAIALGWAVNFVEWRAFPLTSQLIFALQSWSMLFRPHWLPTGLLLPHFVLWPMLSGWLAARLNRKLRTFTVMANAAYFLYLSLTQAIALLYVVVTVHHLTGSPDGFIFGLALMTARPMAVLFGGGLFADHHGSDDSERLSVTS
jgi:hypothetical protein